MDDEQNAKDVAALLGRAGLSTGLYRELGARQTSAGKESEPSALPVSMLPATAPAASTSQAPALPELDRMLAWNAQPARQVPGEKKAATIALFSLAGGVGRTMLAATLSRILAGRSRRVLLANCGCMFALHYLLDARSQRMGAFTFLHAPEGVSALPITLIEAGDAGNEAQTVQLMQQARKYSDQSFLDMPVALTPPLRAMLDAADHVLVPLLPDVHSALTLKAVRAELRAICAAGVEVHYVLNRYDPARALHREMRAQFESMLGSALLPLSIREEPRIQDAMRHCVTVVDHAPRSEVIGDLEALSQWSEKLLPRAPAVKSAGA